MARYELSEATERRVEDALVTLGLAATLSWVLLVVVVQDAVLVGVPPEDSEVVGMIVSAPVGYLAVQWVRDADAVDLETVARAIAVAAFVVTVVVLLYVGLVLGVVVAPW